MPAREKHAIASQLNIIEAEPDRSLLSAVTQVVVVVKMALGTLFLFGNTASFFVCTSRVHGGQPTHR